LPALARVFIWESAKNAPALTRYLQRVGHPFVARGADSLPAPLRGRKRGGRVFELFILPIDVRAMVVTAHHAGARREVSMIFDFSDLPVLMIVRKKRPMDPLHPERELRGILDHLPTWRAKGQAKPVVPSHPTSARSRARPLLYTALVVPRVDGDDKTLAVFGSQT